MVELLLLYCLTHGGEENHIADGLLVGHEHSKTINADAETSGRRHADFKCLQEVLVEHLRLFISLRALVRLVLETRPLVQGIIQFGKGVPHLQATNERLKAIGQTRKLTVLLGQRRDIQWIVDQEKRLLKIGNTLAEHRTLEVIDQA